MLRWMLRRSAHTVTVRPARLLCTDTDWRPERILTSPLGGTRTSNSIAVMAVGGWRGGSMTSMTNDGDVADGLLARTIGGIDTGWAVGPKQAGGHCHIQGLVRALMVIGVHPRVDGFLRGSDRLERRHMVEELRAQRLVEAFDLAGRGR